MITNNNYHEYLIDYFNGNLSHEVEKALLLFINENPEVKEEFDLLNKNEIANTISVEPNPDFSFLKKPSYHQISERFNNLLALKIDERLQEGENAELQIALNAYPELKKDAQLFKLTILQPDYNITYTNKNLLKKKQGAILYLSNYVKYASAIAAALVLGVFIFYFSDKNKPITEYIKPKNNLVNLQPTNINSQQITNITNLQQVKIDIKNTTKPSSLRTENFTGQKTLPPSNLVTKINTKKIQSIQLKQPEYVLNIDKINFNAYDNNQQQVVIINEPNNDFKSLEQLVFKKLTGITFTDSSLFQNITYATKLLAANNPFIQLKSSNEQGLKNFQLVTKLLSIEKTYSDK